MMGVWAQLWLALALQGSGAVVTWDGPASCDATAFEDELSRLLRDSSVAVVVDVSVVESESGWALVTWFEAGPDRVGSRRFEAASCQTVSEAAALAVALAVDPAAIERLEATEPAPAPEPEPDPTPAPVDVPEPTQPPAPASAPPERGPPPDESAPAAGLRRRLGGAVGVAGFAEGLALPGLGGGLSLFGAVRVERVRIELGASYRFPTQAQASDPATVGADFSQWTVALRGLWAPTVGPVEIPVGLGFEGGQTIARARGIAGARPRFEPWLTPLVAAGLTWPAWPWVAFLVRAQLGVPLVRQRFSVIGVQPSPLYQPGPVQLRGIAGVELRFP